MRKKIGLQGRLLILVVAAILPLAGLEVWSAVRSVRSATALAQSQLQLSASLVAAHQDRIVDSTRNLMSAISLVPALRGGDRERCESYFDSVPGYSPIYTNIGLLSPGGDILCHANASLGNPNAADRPYSSKPSPAAGS